MNPRCRWVRAGVFLAAWAVCLLIRAEAPLLLGRIEIPSMMASAQRLSALMEKASPGSSAPVGLGIAALAFNPQLRYFDLTQPIVLFLYVYPEELGGGTQWCFSMGKKEKDIPEMLSDGNTPVYVKDIGDRCFVSRVPGLAEIAAMGDLPPVAAAEEDRDMAITLWPTTGLEQNAELMRQLRGEGARLLFQRAGTNPETMAAARMYHLRFGLMEQLLHQARETTIMIHFTETALDFSGTVTPTPESTLDRFCHDQVDDGAEPVMLSLPEQEGWSGAVDLVATPILRRSIVGFMRDLAMESADQADPAYFSVLCSILDAWTGLGRFCEVPGSEGKPSSFIHYLTVKKEDGASILALAEGEKGEDGSSLFLNQYPNHDELQFRIYESATEVALVQHAESDAAAREALSMSTKNTIETPLCRGEMFFRKHYGRSTLSEPKETAEGEPTPEETMGQEKLFSMDYSCKFEKRKIQYHCTIPAELLEKINPKTLFPTEPSPNRRKR